MIGRYKKVLLIKLIKEIEYFVVCSSSGGSDSSNDESSIYTNESQMTASRDSGSRVTFDSLFPSMKQIYGTEVKPPKRGDLLLYKK